MALFALLAGIPSLAFAQPVDRLGVPGPLSFGGMAYRLAWSSQPSPGYYKQEYLPTGEAPGGYTRMILVEFLDTGSGPRAALAAQVRSLNQRKGKDPLLNMSVMENQQTGEVMLDFLISADERGQLIAEWNAYRYTPLKGTGGRDAVLLFAVSRRAYGDDAIRSFLGELKSSRSGEIGRLARAPVPEIKLPR
ncbi:MULTISPECIES: hypothetical protein [unclassified Bosea (in: a-proteobacteria)]|uniref:hypothetical protein n=1 Tax=unclassified Bosea (in: a-proteobacteria) TaxID=2653178 RepID=UPI000F7F1A17|nr:MULTISPECIES: hypothetical protein [unclassified Bosea (in: a-proteobacteria)]RXT21403.1 hypothetical protein B5U98_12960 [Bosea sp. Tri-39]RXT31742.1 hypothetical protein B5U99_23805 [Bosea sp. Tri-54]